MVLGTHDVPIYGVVSFLVLLPVTETTDTITENVIPLQPRRQKKRKTATAKGGGSSHPPKKLREDYEVGLLLGDPIPTSPFMTSSAFATLERKGEDHTDSAEADSLLRSSVPMMTIVTTTTPTTDLVVIVKEKTVTLYSITNGSRLDDGHVCREMLDEFAPPKFFASIRGMEHNQIFTEFNVGTARQMSLSAEVRMRAEDEEIDNIKAHMLLKEAEAVEAIRLRAKASNFKAVEKSIRDEVNVLNERNTILEKERNALDVKVTDLEVAVASNERELADSNAQLTSIKSQNDNLADQMQKLANYENLTKRLEEFQDAQLKVVNDKFDKLYTNFVEMTLHMEERFYLHLLTTIVGCRWLLPYGIKLAIIKCLNSPEYLSALGIAISKAIEKGMQDELAGVKFPLLVELKSNKDASVEALMNILRLEEHLAERLGLNESQPHVDKLMVPIHHSPDKTVVGASVLSFALGVSDARVQRIWENIESHRPFLHGVFFPLAEPFSAVALTGTEGTSNTAPGTTTALSTTLVSASSIPPISTDDYEVVCLDGQEGAGAESQAITDGNADPFANVDDVDLNFL
nr:hypothetical protein [Tanacetum cinerariifolium]